MLRNVAIWAVAGGLMLVSGSVAQGQAGTVPSASQATPQGAGSGSARLGLLAGQMGGQAGGPVTAMPTDPDASIPPQTEEQQAKMRNAERQKQLVADTQKLLSLATELKADVDKSTKDTMSLDVIRKADEIEKLAHNVKEKMKGT